MTIQRALTASIISSELQLTTSRSSGPGGQNVNKVNTKVTLRFDIGRSQILTQDEKDILFSKLATALTRDGVLVLTAQEKRSQLQNREAVVLKLEKMLAKAFEKKKKRKPTGPSKGSVHRRISGKKRRAEKKKWRQKPGV